jgi:hypothetical protein
MRIENFIIKKRPPLKKARTRLSIERKRKKED